MKENKPMDLSQFQRIESIGKGNYGEVFLVENIQTKKRYAAKIFKQASKETFITEMNSYSKAINPAILRFYGYSLNDFNGNSHPTIILEFMPNGSLYDYINKSKNSQANKYIILLGISIGMKYLHSIGIIHRDLKAMNVLLDDNFYPKICDFGISYLSPKLELSQILMKSYKGTPISMAPEIINESFYTYKVDVYAFSLIMYELLKGIVPFKEFNNNKYKLFDYVKNGGRPDVSFIEDKSIQAFIEKCWDNDPVKRPSFIEIVKELMDKMGAEQGDSESIYKFAIMLFYGQGFPMNKDESVKYFKMAVDKGNQKAMNAYGCLLYLGEGIQENKEESLIYLKKAADLGNKTAKINYEIALNKSNKSYELSMHINEDEEEMKLIIKRKKKYSFGLLLFTCNK